MSAAPKTQEKQVINVMVDLETLGTKSYSGILSIGATTFGHPGIVIENNTFYKKCSLKSLQDKGFMVDRETLEWWQKQDPKVKEEAFSGTEDVAAMIMQFSHWIQQMKQYGTIHIWGNGIDFDGMLLVNAFHKLDYKSPPWAFWNHRCFRTLKNLFPQVAAPEFIGKKHCAIDDAIHQAKHAEIIFKYMELHILGTKLCQ